jgi:hypothetical protein
VPRGGFEPPALRVGAACTSAVLTRRCGESREGIEPSRTVLQTRLPPTEPAHELSFRAATGNRTRIPKLATSASTIEISPRSCGADSGNRTRIDSLEDCGPTLGRCPRADVTLSRPRESNPPSPRYQRGAPPSGPGRHFVEPAGIAPATSCLPDRRSTCLSYDPSFFLRWSGGESNPDSYLARVEFYHLNYFRPGREPGNRTRLARVLEARRRPSPAPYRRPRGESNPPHSIDNRAASPDAYAGQLAPEWPRLRFLPSSKGSCSGEHFACRPWSAGCRVGVRGSNPPPQGHDLPSSQKSNAHVTVSNETVGMAGIEPTHVLIPNQAPFH